MDRDMPVQRVRGLARVFVAVAASCSPLECVRNGTQNEWMTIWKHVRYSGTVQGVGFRYTAERMASNHGVNGYVRNLPTGDVEVVVGGEEEVVRAFLDSLANRMAAYIERTNETEAAALDCSGFHIRY